MNHSNIEAFLASNPYIFPSYTSFKSRPECEVDPTDDLTSYQLRWIGESDRDVFLSSRSAVVNTMTRSSEPAKGKLRSAYEKRMYGIVCTAALKSDSFPTIRSLKIEYTDESKAKVSENIGRYAENFSLTASQVRWIQEAPRDVLLSNLHAITSTASKSNPKTSDELLSAAKLRMQKIAEAEALKSTQFPSRTFLKVSYVDDNSQKTVGKTTLLKYVDLTNVQVKWVENAEENIFLSNLRSVVGVANKTKNVTKRQLLRRASKKKLRSIVIKKLQKRPYAIYELATHLGISRRPIDEIEDIKELIFQAKTLHGERSTDQQIVSSIGIYVNRRARWLKELIKRRLTQLWFFRRLIAVLKFLLLRNIKEATIISFTHQSITKRANKIVSGVTTNHYFLDAIMVDPTRVDGPNLNLQQTIILLSVLQFIDDKLTASILRNLALSTREDQELVATFNVGRMLDPTAIGDLRELGWELEDTTDLILDPPEGVDVKEEQKIDEAFRTIRLRRNGHNPSYGVKELDLLLTIDEEPTSGTPTSSEGVSYSTDDLTRAEVSSFSYGRAIMHDGEVPGLVDLTYEDDLSTGFTLKLSDGEDIVDVGFNMDPSNANTAELDRSADRLNGKIVEAGLNIMRGREAVLRVPASLKDKYDLLINKLRERKLKVKRTRVRKVQS